MEQPPRLVSILDCGRYIGTTSSGVLHSLMKERDLDSEKVEGFIIVILDSLGRVITSKLISTGGPRTVMVSITDTFREAVKQEKGIKIVVAHNHPDGNPHPSDMDQTLTATLKQAATLLGIELVDHLVIGDDSFYSFNENHYYTMNSNVVPFGVKPMASIQHGVPQPAPLPPVVQQPENQSRYFTGTLRMPKPPDALGFTYEWDDTFGWYSKANTSTMLGRFWKKIGI